MFRGEPGAGDQQQTAGILVESVDQARSFGGLELQGIEHAVDMALGAGSPLHGEPRRLVEGDDMVDLMRNRRKFLRQSTVFAPRACSRPDQLFKRGVHRRRPFRLATSTSACSSAVNVPS